MMRNIAARIAKIWYTNAFVQINVELLLAALVS